MKSVWEVRCDGQFLTAALAEQGVILDQRCNGSGRCRRCRVTLLSGRWLVEDREYPIAEPMEVLACRCRLLSPSGTVMVPEDSLTETTGHTLASWHAAPLPATGETVIGIDLGTTTIAAAKLQHGRIVAEAGAFNRQNRYGDNVISRIVHAGKNPAALAELTAAAIETINELLQQLGTGAVARIAISGNTVMSLLLHGMDPSAIGAAPFLPPCRTFPVKPAASLALDAPPDVPVLTLPCISGYLGGDILAGWRETGLRPGEMLADLGTNCEILFCTSRGIFGTTAAAGPAFEGAAIACGRRAVPGAISHIAADGSLTVIGNETPRGICGSGMIDFLAVWRATGRLTEFGRLDPPAPTAGIAPGVTLSESDIEQLLKAKAAISAGIQVLEEHCGETASRLKLAGGFARYLEPDSAKQIGMLPDRTIEIVGNTSLSGALRLAAEPELLPQLEAMSDEPTEVLLNTEPGFEDAFIDGLLLP